MKEKTVEKTTENTVEVKKKMKLPKEISQEIVKNIFGNLVKAVSIMIYFVILNLAYTNIKQERLTGDIQVFAGMFLVFGILMLEKAYKKDSGTIAISSIELLFLSLHTLSIMHITSLLKYDFRTYLIASSYVFSIYYVLKSIIIYTKGRKDYFNNLSDISEIVKKDEPVKKEAKKRNNDVENEEKIVKTKKETNKKETSKKVITEKKKIQNKNTENEKESKTKKIDKKDKDESKEKEIKAIQEETPKRKRGRPKKEVKEND